MTAPAIREAAQSFVDASAQQDAAIEALSRFLTGEIVKSDARLAPCVCGHVVMFCACEEQPK